MSTRSRTLAAAPATVPALAALAVFVWWSADQGGQPITIWGPGALILLALLAVAAASIPVRWGEIPGALRVAALGLAAYALWSYLSIAWAADPGVALEGANRTLLYAVVFALFALWPQRPPTAALILGAWTLAMIVFAVITAVRMGTGPPRALFLSDRLGYPAGYPNGSAAVFLMALWPAVTLAAAREVPWPLRGAFGGGAVVLAELALLTLSRGALFTVPVVVVILFALVPGRLRHAATLVPIGLAIAAASSTLLHVGDVLSDPHAAAGPAVDAAVRAILIGAIVVGAIVATVAALEPRIAPATGERLRRGGAIAAVLAVVVIAIGGLAAVGDPVHRLSNAWHSFTGGYAQNATSSNRLLSGLGSNRYDFYRVALHVFAEHPLAGAGADNYFQQYLRDGHSDETPHYPHSVELRTLEQTGIVGALILLTALAAALWAAARAMYRLPGLGAAVAGGATMAFVYWLAHGSFDWFWEFAGLGAPAFALLGLAGALNPRPDAVAAEPAPDEARGRPWAAIAVAVAGVAGALIIAAAWLSARDVDRAAKIYAARPLQAYALLDQAGSLNPLSDEPALVAGGIALRFNDLARADAQFADALGRVPDGAYATLERGAIASAQGRHAAALALLERAAALNPRDPLTEQSLGVVRSGGTIDVDNLNRAILSQAQELTR